MTDNNTDMQDFQGRENFVEDIHGKSDRAVAIVGAAFLNSHLELLLSSFFSDDTEDGLALLGTDRPLGTFGSRIRLSYVLGLISKEERDDLWAVNQIKERFMRELGEVSFEDEPAREWCFTLSLPQKVLVPGETRTPRRFFVFAVALLVRQLTLRIDAAEHQRRTPPVDSEMVETDR